MSSRVGTVLWNPAISQLHYGSAGEKYQIAVLEQYKVYVEIMDRVSARRMAVNTFFLTLNSAVIGIVGIFWKDRPVGSPWLLVPVLVLALGECFSWYRLISSYRDLNSAKYMVVAALEERLPARAFSKAEGDALGLMQSDWHRYKPVILWENLVPQMFGAAYIFGFVAAVLST